MKNAKIKNSTTLIKRTLSLAFIVCILMSFPLSVGAVPGGVADIDPPVEPLAKQFEDDLLHISSSEQRQLLLEKAASMGITADDLANVSLSAAELAILEGNVSMQRTTTVNAFNNRNILTNPSLSRASAAGVIVAGVEMPDYCLWPTIKRQLQNNWCTAATIETVGLYIGANPPSQSDIMAFWIDYWDVTYPDLPLMRNYLRDHLPGKPSNFVSYQVKTYGNSQTTFNQDLKNNVLNYQPMMTFMKNPSGTTNWPYIIPDGHAFTINGLLTWENNQYFIGDPYYFSQWVSGAGSNGEHKRTWSQLNTVIQNRFGTSNGQYLT